MSFFRRQCGFDFKSEPREFWVDDGESNNLGHPSYDDKFSLPATRAEEICNITSGADLFTRELEYLRCAVDMAQAGRYFTAQTIFRAVVVNTPYPEFKDIALRGYDALMEAAKYCGGINIFEADRDFMYLGAEIVCYPDEAF